MRRFHAVGVTPRVFRFCSEPVVLFSVSCRGKFAALENISCKIKSGCEGHLPWPEGICTKCQPSALTLNRQVLTMEIYFIYVAPFIQEELVTVVKSSLKHRFGVPHNIAISHISVRLYVS